MSPTYYIIYRCTHVDSRMGTEYGTKKDGDLHSCLPSSSSKSGGIGENTAERGPNTAVASVATAVVWGGKGEEYV